VTEMIQRHQVVKAAEENGWVRCAAPGFDIFSRHVPGGDPTTIEVHYFATSGRIQGARICDLAMHTSVPITRRPGMDKLAGILLCLRAPGA